ncbi:hypothetical protein [Paraburkholderia gardini]|uniref:hypothetical protein n=1 Tax=Paraburkholderia gardini TaxID=2823469 RepID=UPI001E12E649|nr:hypothetical protein [Paraburkholderia gardini]CAG4889483.1 hypothetical protein R69919_00754 [Paraburkholderia gardini]
MNIKPIILLLACSIASPAFATTPDQMTTCSLKAELYASAAKMRDENQTPQDAAKFLGAYKGKYISADDFKNVINTVYFDDRFANAGGFALQKQMLDYCLNGPPPALQPLE